MRQRIIERLPCQLLYPNNRRLSTIVVVGAVEPLAESLARGADERNALIVLLLARTLTQNIEVGGNRPAGGYDGAAERFSFHGSMVSRRCVGVEKIPIALKMPGTGNLSVTAGYNS